MCKADWAIISKELDEAPAKIDFSHPKTIADAKRMCDPSRLNRVSLWPQFLKTQLALCQGEIAHTLGRYDEAKRYFEQVKTHGPSALAARASYRIAEIAEQTIWTMPAEGKLVRDPELAHQEITHFLSGVRDARNSFMQVASLGDPFWSRRAAFRVISIVDDALWEIRTNLYVANLQGRYSPFEILFGHFIENRNLDEQLFGLEQERALLEQSLFRELQESDDDPVLLNALLQRAQDPFAISTSFAEYIEAPWANEIESLPFVKIQKRYFENNGNQTVKPLSRPEALRRIRFTVSQKTNPLALAFAIAYLSDEGEPVSEETIKNALQSEHVVLRIAGLYAAEMFASHSLTPSILEVWKNTPMGLKDHPAFFTVQNTLFAQKERILLCLARHFSLGRTSTQMILESKDLGDSEKAWLLQFRRDKKSSSIASSFLKHPNPIVRSRTQHAMRVWNRNASA